MKEDVRLKRLSEEEIDRAIEEDERTEQVYSEYLRIQFSFPPVLKGSDVPLEQREQLQVAWTRVLFAAADYINRQEER